MGKKDFVALMKERDDVVDRHAHWSDVRKPWNQKTGLRQLSPPHKEKTGSWTTCTCLRTNTAERKRRRSATGRGTDLVLASATVKRRRSAGRGHAPGHVTGKTKRKRRR